MTRTASKTVPSQLKVGQYTKLMHFDWASFGDVAPAKETVVIHKTSKYSVWVSIFLYGHVQKKMVRRKIKTFKDGEPYFVIGKGTASTVYRLSTMQTA